MKPLTVAGLILIVLVISSATFSIGNNIARAQVPENIAQTLRVAVRIGSDLDQDSTLQAKRLLENKGLPYDIIADTNTSKLTTENYGLTLVLGSTQPQISPDAADIKNAVEKGAGLIWIGQGLPENLQDLVGINYKGTTELAQGAARIRYGDASTHLYSETIELVDSTNATAKGYFVDDSDQTVDPAELSFKKGTAGLTYYFAYDAFSWWFADEETPWLRAYRVHLAIEDVISEHMSVRLLPYPRGMQSAFITRIEDVDPLHTNPEWLNRGEQMLNYYSDNNGALTVGLTPTYVDPALGLNFGIEEPTAHALKEWLSKVLMRGGTIVEHGYTHQIGNEKTGVAPEFFDETTQKWLSLENQKLRISTGASQIYESLGFDPKGFEPPHYVANSDTYQALSELGFLYVTQNSNTAFFDRLNLSQGLVNVPETLGYIPIDSAPDVKARIESNMDYLYNMSGLMLYFNHLFDDQMLQIGKELFNYVSAKENVWLTNADTLADFWAQRYRAYQDMITQMPSDENSLTVTLGPSNRAGLTLAIDNSPQVRGVSVNGVQWPVFNGSQVILPVLPENQNTIVITFEETDTNTNQVFGYPIIILSIIVSAFIVLRKSGFKKLIKSPSDWRKKQ
ncbi:MAG TPA: DUF2334 domain-containing protein [Candidatus Bathyarchaeia archaeon]|nr:DUF2334 domain-containing protein [Candidatus Bathyarchaeia archaeon]